MNIKKLYEEYITRVSGTIFLCSAAVLLLNSRLSVKAWDWLLLLSVLLLTVLAVVFDLIGKKTTLLIITAVSVFLTLFFCLFSVPAVKTAADSFRWLSGFIEEDGVQALKYAFLSAELILIPLCFIVFAVIRYKPVRLVLGIVFSVLTVILAVFEYNAGGLTVLFIFLFILSAFYEFTVKNNNAAAYLLPIILVTGISIAVLPSKKEPISWQFVKSIISAVGDFIISTGENIAGFIKGETGEYEVSMTGFSENGELRGSGSSSDKPALEVKNSKSAQNLYLTGTVMDTYTGKGWEKNQNLEGIEYPEYIMDALELMLSVYGADALSEGNPNSVYNIMAIREAEIKYSGISTKSLFYPLKAVQVISDERTYINGAGMLFNRKKSGNTAYRIKYMDFNYQNDIIKGILRNSKDFSGYEEVSSYNLFSYFSKIPGYIFPKFKISEGYIDELEKRKDTIYENYTSLPETVPLRVYDLASEITSGYDNAYDKMKAIESYLNGFSYTLTPPEIPDRDFTDWFLFEEKNGYCTYFATAAAVLGRTLGIPTRYVQGFAAYVSDNITIIENRNAHAWTEAYIDGFGWVPFEATPSYYNMRNGNWKTNAPVLNKPVTNITSNYEPVIPPVNTELIKREAEIKKERRDLYFSVLSASLLSAAAILTAVIICLYLLFIKSKKSYGSSDIKERFIRDFNTVLFLLELKGEKIQPGETLREFSKRLNVQEFNLISGSHERIIYADVPASEEELTLTAAYLEKLLDSINNRTDKFKYILYIIKGT